jgi:DNA-binding MarR family transcriptional regulator
MLLQLIFDNISNLKELMKRVDIKKSQFYNAIKQLENQEYIEKVNSKVFLKQNAKSILLRDLSKRYNIEKVLHDSNEIVFYNLTEPKKIQDIQKLTSLSGSTIERVFSELFSIGAASRKEDKIILNPEDPKLKLFAQLLKTETEKKNVERYAEIIYSDSNKTIKMVPKGYRADGELTGFSLFTEYGIQYNSVYDYYVVQSSDLKLEDILVHSILISTKDNDKNEMVMCIIFYLKYKQKMDSLQIRSIARLFGIVEIWLDIENYVRKIPTKNTDFFVPFSEFEEKARLYDISADAYEIPIAYPTLFKELGSRLSVNAQLYLFGGENMRIKNLKPSTKDCDVVTINKKSFTAVTKVLKKLGFRSINQTKLSNDDLRISPSDILINQRSHSRIDIFNKKIMRKFILSQRMKRRAKIEIYGKLKLGILQNEDVFLLKGITQREGDIQDMSVLAQSTKFNWNIVYDELVRQEEDIRMHFAELLLFSLDYLMEKTGIRSPIYRKVVKRTLDNKIEDQIAKKKKISVNDLIGILEGGDITEKMIRNRISYLIEKKYLKKSTRNKFLRLKA